MHFSLDTLRRVLYPPAGDPKTSRTGVRRIKIGITQTFPQRVKIIYNPPYNTGNEGWCYNDNVSDPHIQKWLGEVVGKEGEDLTRHDKWLCMMYPRLMLLQKLLADDGVIFISIDDNELYRFDEFLKILGKL